jgi:hypothetical protein
MAFSELIEQGSASGCLVFAACLLPHPFPFRAQLLVSPWPTVSFPFFHPGSAQDVYMSVVPAGSSSLAPPSLLDAIGRSTDKWQEDLENLFRNAAERFPDVVWELLPDADDGQAPEEVWGHKGPSPACAPATRLTRAQRSCTLAPRRRSKPGTFRSGPRPYRPRRRTLTRPPRRRTRVPV